MHAGETTAQLDVESWLHDAVQLFGVRPLDARSSIESFGHVHDHNQVTIGCLNNCCQALHMVSLVPSVVNSMQRQSLCAIEPGCTPRIRLRGEWVWIGAHATSNICHLPWRCSRCYVLCVACRHHDSIIISRWLA